MDPIIGIDLSRYNWSGGVPFDMLPRLQAKGVRFLIARATIGTTRDKSFRPNRNRGTFRSWVPGAYHFLYPGVDAADQAKAFCDYVTDTGGGQGLIMALDVEYNRGERPRLRDVRAWVDQYRERFPKHPLGVYSNRSTWGALGNPDVEDLGFDYAWHAYWPDGTDTPADLPDRPPVSFGGEGRSPLWQWGTLEVRTGSGRMARLDGNAWYGTMQQLEDLANRERVPYPERPAYRKAYNDTVAAATKAVQALVLPDGTPAQVAGHTAAQDAATEAVSDLRLGR